jgi:hypothetical protein
LVQTSPDPHVLPHAPQFFESTLVSAHDDPHSVVPPPQLVPHLPCEHTSPEGHAVPQAPQFALSSWRFTQLPLQSVPFPQVPDATSIAASPLSSPPLLQPAENAPGAKANTAIDTTAAQPRRFKPAFIARSFRK